MIPPLFDGPAPRARAAAPPGESVINPFSVYRNGEPFLRRQLSALSSRHLVKIILAHRLSGRDKAALSAMPPTALVETIIEGVRQSEPRPER